MSYRKALDHKYIEAVKAVWATGLFNYSEIGRIFFINRNTVRRYVEG